MHRMKTAARRLTGTQKSAESADVKHTAGATAALYCIAADTANMPGTLQQKQAPGEVVLHMQKLFSAAT